MAPLKGYTDEKTSPAELSDGKESPAYDGSAEERIEYLAKNKGGGLPPLSAEAAAIDEKKLMRKIDFRLIPWLSLLYLISFLDRTNIGNARLYNLEEDLGMDPQGEQYVHLHGHCAVSSFEQY